MSVGERVKTLREAQNLSISELAERADVTRSYVWQLERGENRNPAAEALYRIAKVLNVTVGDLLGESVVLSDDYSIGDLPPGLGEFLEERQSLKEPLSYEDISALTSVKFRGRQPCTKEEWRHLYEMLNMSSRGWTDG